jgi:hypothetical protein
VVHHDVVAVFRILRHLFAPVRPYLDNAPLVVASNQTRPSTVHIITSFAEDEEDLDLGGSRAWLPPNPGSRAQPRAACSLRIFAALAAHWKPNGDDSDDESNLSLDDANSMNEPDDATRVFTKTHRGFTSRLRSNVNPGATTEPI